MFIFNKNWELLEKLNNVHQKIKSEYMDKMGKDKPMPSEAIEVDLDFYFKLNEGIMDKE